jgi:hypothetical protein
MTREELLTRLQMVANVQLYRNAKADCDSAVRWADRLIVVCC